jgi:uncharacterized protein
MADSSRRQKEEVEEYVVRAYRDFAPRARFTAFSVKVKETDLFIRAGRDLSDQAFQAVRACREQIEGYIRRNPDFRTSLKPLPQDPGAPPIVGGMIEAARRAGVGPMAGVAGAVAEYVGRALKAHSREVIVENGGDIYLHATHPVLVSIFAGRSPLSGKLGIRIRPEETPCGVCTSSGTVGPSLSFGSTDAVTVRAASTVLADAAATALGNRIRKPEEIEPALERAGEIEGVQGVVVILGDRIGLWGDLELVRLTPGNGEKGSGPGP